MHDLSELKLSDRLIERYLCKELEGDELLTFEKHLSEDEALRAHIDERRAEQRAFAQLNPMPAFLTQSAPQKRSFGNLYAFFSLSAAAAALLLFVALPNLSESTGDGLRARGASQSEVNVTVKRGKRLFALQSQSALLRKGDALRVDLKTPQSTHLVLGLVSKNQGSVLLSQKIKSGNWSQPSSLVLDDALDKETLVVVQAQNTDLAKAAEADIIKGQIPKGALLWTYEKEPLP